MTATPAEIEKTSEDAGAGVWWPRRRVLFPWAAASFVATSIVAFITTWTA
ncbi:MAG TPA: hypothetical protein VIJ18_12525 [Microbacteriaceae bacterium]